MAKRSNRKPPTAKRRPGLPLSVRIDELLASNAGERFTPAELARALRAKPGSVRSALARSGRKSRGGAYSAPKPRQRRALPILDHSAVAIECAAALDAEGFTVDGDPHSHEASPRGAEVWHFFSWDFVSTYTLDGDTVAALFEPIRPILTRHYHRQAILKIAVVALDNDGEVVFRHVFSVSSTANIRDAFTQIAGNVEKWGQRVGNPSSHATDITGIAAECRTPEWYEHG